ncbi:MAG: molybdenum cofactor guanylyltransferase MobA [Campylobacterota bacterium]|nr:molybdenum cofactor guanylyltransferase MobA [Campylobacterota bacterium]
MIHDIPLIIFAGGKSSRMGSDKSLLPFGGYPTLTQYQYTRLCKEFQRLYISSKTDKFNFECIVIKDTQEAYSPLIALCSIFERLKHDEIFILSVDAPFVDSEVIKKILAHREPLSQSVVAKSPSGIQPLCGYYKKSILPLIHAQLEKGNHKLLDLLSLAKTKLVAFEDDTPFTNLNHPSDYQNALKLI